MDGTQLQPSPSPQTSAAPQPSAAPQAPLAQPSAVPPVLASVAQPSTVQQVTVPEASAAKQERAQEAQSELGTTDGRSQDAPPAELWEVIEPSGAQHEFPLEELIRRYALHVFEPGTLVRMRGQNNWLPPYDVPQISRALTDSLLITPAPAPSLAPVPSKATPSEAAPSFSDETVTLGVAESVALSQQALALGGVPSSPPLSSSIPAPSTLRRPRPALTSPEFAEEEDATVIHSLSEQEKQEAPSTPQSASPLPNLSLFPEEEDEEATRIFEPDWSQESAKEAPLLGGGALSTAPTHPLPPAPDSPVPQVSNGAEPSVVLAAQPSPVEAPSATTAGSPQPAPSLTQPEQPTQQVLRLPQSDPAQAPQRSRLPLLLLVGALLAGGAFAWTQPELVQQGWQLARTQTASLWQIVTGETGPSPVASETPGVPFDTQAAHRELKRALEQTGRCQEPGGVLGQGRVQILFDPSGKPLQTQLSEPFQGTSTGRCLSDLFAQTRVPAFVGEPVLVTKTFTLR